MKRRLDFVTNSSSSSYTIALYKEKPDAGDTYCFANMPISTCNMSALYSLWYDFSSYVRDDLAVAMYDNGLDDELRFKYYQFLFLENLSKNYVNRAKEIDEAKIIAEGFGEIEQCLRNGYSLVAEEKEVQVEYPMIPSRSYDKNLDREFLSYFETYDRVEMLDYLETIDKTYETLTKWFENLTGCTWVITCSWEDDNPPKGMVMRIKSDDWDSYLEG